MIDESIDILEQKSDERARRRSGNDFANRFEAVALAGESIAASRDLRKDWVDEGKDVQGRTIWSVGDKKFAESGKRGTESYRLERIDIDEM